MLRFSMKKRNFLVLTFLVGFFLCISFIGFFNFLRFSMDIGQKELLVRENRKLRRELKELKEKISEIDLLVDSLYLRNLALRTYLEIDFPEKDPEIGGIGGVLEEPRNPVVRELKDLEREVERLLRFSRAELKDLSYIEEKLKEDSRKREHTPSLMPTSGFLTSKFGFRRDPFTGDMGFHPGIDIAAPSGTPVIAPAAGKVKSVRWLYGYGLTIEIDHGYGFTTRYAHVQRAIVKPGQKVRRGEIIAYVGKTGRTTGPHLHYEVRMNRRPVNPTKYIIPPTAYYD